MAMKISAFYLYEDTMFMLIYGCQSQTLFLLCNVHKLVKWQSLQACKPINESNYRSCPSILIWRKMVPGHQWPVKRNFGFDIIASENLKIGFKQNSEASSQF